MVLVYNYIHRSLGFYSFFGTVVSQSGEVNNFNPSPMRDDNLLTA